MSRLLIVLEKICDSINKDQDIADDGGLVRRLLGLKETGNEFRVVYGSVSTADDEIALLTRSIIEVFSDIFSTVEVPTEHVAEKKVTPTMQEEGEGVKPPLIGIHHSAKPPEEAFVAVEYRDNWFWIDDRDYHSKKLFSLRVLRPRTLLIRDQPTVSLSLLFMLRFGIQPQIGRLTTQPEILLRCIDVAKGETLRVQI